MRCLLAALTLATALTAPAFAEPRALLIGVGQYQSPDISKLPGIDKDIAQMGDLAKRMGVRAPELLMDRSATRANILAAMRRALLEGVGPDDLVLIYYSGHGTQIEDEDNDEEDGGDEVILGYDTAQAVRADGNGGFRGVVKDDEIADLIRQSPSRNIMLIVDACNSGTIDKSAPLPGAFQGTRTGVAKFYRYAGMPAGRPKPFVSAKSVGVEGRAQGGAAKYVSMSAASDLQSAMATSTGSVFTVGITRAVANKSATGEITPRDMLEGAKRYIVEQGMTQTPEIHGATELVEKPLRLTGVSSGNGPNWERARSLADKMTKTGVNGVKARYVEGERLVFDIEVPTNGYLNIIDVGPDDNITLLYPNRFQSDNRVSAGRFTMPGNALPFDLPARAPYGRSMIVAFITTEPLSLLASAADGKTATLAAPSLAGLETADQIATRSFGAEARTQGRASWAGVAETEVCNRDGRCR